jgi:hypothetical protein
MYVTIFEKMSKSHQFFKNYYIGSMYYKISKVLSRLIFLFLGQILKKNNLF